MRYAKPNQKYQIDPLILQDFSGLNPINPNRDIEMDLNR